MKFSVATLFVLAGLCLALAESKIHPRSIPREVIKRMNMKRQMSTEDQCVDDKLESALENSDCDASIVELLIVSLSSDYEDEDELGLLAGFRIFCTPECGIPILEVHDECNYFDDSPFLRELLVGLCATNEKGAACYITFESAFAFINDTEIGCYLLSKLSEKCQCRDDLLPAVEEQGCCINLYHEAIRSVLEENTDIVYKPNELYTEYCDIDLPGDCDNSPIGGSVPIGYTLFSIATAAVLAMLT